LRKPLSPLLELPLPKRTLEHERVEDLEPVAERGQGERRAEDIRRPGTPIGRVQFLHRRPHEVAAFHCGRRGSPSRDRDLKPVQDLRYAVRREHLIRIHRVWDTTAGANPTATTSEHVAGDTAATLGSGVDVGVGTEGSSTWSESSACT
jgi:hypothetical protein